MNDLKNGILDINGFLVGPNTTFEEIENYFGIKGRKSRSYSYFDLGGQSFANNGIMFKVLMSFDNKLDNIKLYPQLPDLIVKYDVGGDWKYPTTGDPNKDLLYFREIRVVMDEWLEKQLGDPIRKNDSNTTYEFPPLWINISSYYQDVPHGFVVHGGKVTIRYE